MIVDLSSPATLLVVFPILGFFAFLLAALLGPWFFDKVSSDRPFFGGGQLDRRGPTPSGRPQPWSANRTPRHRGGYGGSNRGGDGTQYQQYGDYSYADFYGDDDDMQAADSDNDDNNDSDNDSD